MKTKIQGKVADTVPKAIINEICRLQKLENGVRYYSGGIISLHERVKSVISSPHPHPGEIDILLNDLSTYLRDLKAAGNLTDDC